MRAIPEDSDGITSLPKRERHWGRVNKMLRVPYQRIQQAQERLSVGVLQEGSNCSIWGSIDTEGCKY